MKTENKALNDVVQAITAKVPPDMRDAFDRLVLAGTRLMYADETEGMLRKQMDDGTPPQAAGRGAAKLLGILMTKLKGTPPKKVMPYVGIVLTCEALDFMEKAGRVKVTPEIVAQAVKEFGPTFLQLLGVSSAKLQQLMGDSAQAQPGAQPGAPQGAQPQPAAAAPPRAGAIIGAVA